MIDEKYLISLIKKALTEAEMPTGTSIDAFTTSPKVDNELGVVLIDDGDEFERTFNIRVIDCDFEASEKMAKESADQYVKSLGE